MQSENLEFKKLIEDGAKKTKHYHLFSIGWTRLQLLATIQFQGKNNLKSPISWIDSTLNSVTRDEQHK